MKRAFMLMAMVGVLVGAPVAAWAEDGAATAEEAASGLLKAWHERDREAFAALVNPDEREEWIQLFECSEVKEHDLGEVTEDGDAAEAAFTWTCTLDTDKFAKALLDSARKEMVGQGLSEEQIAQQLEVLRGMMPGAMPMIQGHVEKKEHTMALVKREGRWFVDEPFEDLKTDR